MGNGGIVGIGRELTWDEMTNEQKILKLQSELRRTQEQVKRQGEFLSDMINHSHDNEKILIPIPHPYRESNENFYFRVEDYKDIIL